MQELISVSKIDFVGENSMKLDKFTENKIVVSSDMQIEKDYWHSKLEKGNSVTSFPRYDRGIEEQGCKTLSFSISGDIYERIISLSNKSEFGVFMVLLSSIEYLLYKYTGNDDITVVMPAFKQKGEGKYFRNLLLLRSCLKADYDYKKLLTSIKDTVIGADKHQNYPFGKVAEYIGIEFKDAEYKVGTFIMMDNIHDEEYLNEVNSDMAFCFKLKEDRIDTLIRYDINYYNKIQVEKMFFHMLNFLDDVTKNVNITISQVDVITDSEKKEILFDFNDTRAEYQRETTIHRKFEEQVIKTPDKIAAIFGKNKLTYRELNGRANRLARVLKEKGVTADNIVGIMVERSLEMIVGILAILKAGGAYMPISPSYPQDRIYFMMEDSKAQVLLTQKCYADNYKFVENVIDLDDEDIYTGDDENLEESSNSNNLAYVIYTSGSTGKPKGVMIEHYSVINRLNWMQKKYPISENDVILQKTPFSFDVSVWELFWWGFNGASVCFLIPGGEKEPETIVDAIIEHKITVMHFVPSMLNLFLEYIEAENEVERVKSLKQVFASGEALNLHQVRKFNRLLYKQNGTKLSNLYGPTEATVDVSYFDCSEESDINEVPIGRPIDNINMYIVDKNLKLQPIGVEGELVIAGDGLARGYLNRPSLTEEKFVVCQFAENKRVYRTGDLARWMTDGNIEFLGRKDFQVKIRGNRVELGEIEARLKEYKDIRNTVVVLKEDKTGDKYICAYIVSDANPTVIELREYLMTDLPEYMIPSYFIKIKEIPLTANGKIDRKALPEPDTNVNTGAEFVAPRNEVEEKLVKVWNEVLGVENIGIKDSFFALGGDSIKGLQVLSRLHGNNLKLTMKDLFNYPTIEELSTLVEVVTREVYQGTVEGYINATPIQRWFFENELIGESHFNQSLMVFKKDGFDFSAVEKAFVKLVEHHDALRIICKKEKGQVEQYNRGIVDRTFLSKEVDLNGKDNYRELIEEEANRVQAGIDIWNGPLVSICLFKTSEGDHLLIAIHHLVVDAVSWRIILEDLAKAYDQAVKGQEILFDRKTDSYKYWAERISEYSNSKNLLSEIDFWARIENVDDIRPLPKDNEVNERKYKNSNIIQLILDEEETTNLLKNINRAYNTEVNDILITALGLAVKEWTGMEKVAVNIEGHGREEIIDDININRTVGWFTSLYPLILDMQESDNLSYLIRYIKDTIRSIPKKGVGYGIIKYLTEKENKATLKFKLEPEISFNYFGELSDVAVSEQFNVSHLSAGNSVGADFKRKHAIDVNCFMSDGKFFVEFTYNSDEYRKDTILDMVGYYKKVISTIIDHCLKKEQPELTPSDYGDMQLTFGELEQIKKIVDRDIKKIYPLSPTQEGMLFHSLLDTKSDVYFEQAVLSVDGDFDEKLFEKSFNLLVDRYDILRTTIVFEGIKRPRQVVLRECPATIRFEEIKNLSESEKEAYLKEFKLKDRAKGFDLKNNTLIRVSLLKLSDQSYKIIWSFHHILMDGWCLGIIIKEFLEIYKEVKEGKLLQNKIIYSYSEYINWIERQEKVSAHKFWKSYLEGYEQAAVLPGKKIAVDEPIYKQEEIVFSINEHIMAKLKDIALDCKVTINTVFQAIWGIMLQRYNNTEDVVFGAVVSGRPSEIKGIEDTLGLFINTIPVRVTCDRNWSFNELIVDMQKAALKANEYSYYSLAEIQSDSYLKNSLINHILIFENYPMEKVIFETESNESNNFLIKDFEFFEQTNYDFNIMFLPGTDFKVRFVYNAIVYDKNDIQNIKIHFMNLAENLAKSGEVTIGNLDLLSVEEKTKILFGFNDTVCDYPRETIHSLFEKQVRKSPERIALVFGNTMLTYGGLNEKSNQLAAKLRHMGVKPNSTVGLMVKPSIDMITGIIGILKAGGAYIPLDPQYPSGRIMYMLKDSGVKLLLSQPEFTDSIEFNGEILDITDEELYKGDCLNLENTNTPEDLAYIIYTSGSTGMPKGVMLEHRGVVNFIEGMSEYIEFIEEKAILAVTTMCFDIFVLETLLPLSKGLKVVIADEYQQKDPKLLAELITKNKINIMQTTPSRLKLLTEMKELDFLSVLDELIVGGEAFPSELFEVLCKSSNARIYNVYGPTETTVWSTIKELSGSEPINIGKPIANTQIYILNKDNSVQPIGVPGEMYIAGDGMARGYLKNPEQTNDRFIPNPYMPGKLMYKTGDMAKWLPNGEIEFLGRADYQVKIRGYRVELSEIEAQMAKHDLIKEVVVTANALDENSNYLCAYYISDRVLATSEIREFLLRILPNYMVPSYFIKVEQFPFTPNGKVDRKLLPIPQGIINTGNEYVAPRDDIEKELVAICCEILGIERAGINDNLFDLGGNSVLLVRIYSQIEKIYPGIVSVVDLFTYPTISKLAAFIKDKKSSANKKIQFSFIEFPEVYFKEEGEESKKLIYEFAIDGVSFEKIKTISLKEGTNFRNIILAVYIQLFYEITEKSQMTFSIMFDRTNEAVQLDIDLNDVSDFQKLLRLVIERKNFCSDEKNYKLSDLIESAPIKKPGYISAFIYSRDLLSENVNLFDAYDISFVIEEQDNSINISCEFDVSRLNKDKILELTNTYIELMELFIDSYELD